MLHRVCLLVCLAKIVSGTCLPAAEPVKLAGTARLDIKAEDAQGELAQPRLAQGQGKVGRMHWLPAADQKGGLTADLKVSPFAWRAFAIEFVPQHTGRVQVSLMGPWNEQSPGVLWKQEVGWDDLRAEGAELPNGGFENDSSGWQSNGGKARKSSSTVSAAAGDAYAQTWHNATLSISFPVRDGKPVTLHLKARSIPTEELLQIPRLGNNTPAHKSVKRFQRGVNFGNWLEAPRDQDWGAHYSESDFRNARQEGFDHVRLPIAWQNFAGPGPEFRLEPEIFAKVDPLVEWARKHELGLIINIHHFDAFDNDPDAAGEQFLKLWQQIAAHYQKGPEALAFELLNEPHKKATTAAINPWYARVLPLIRKTNPQRAIFVGPGEWNSVRELANLRLPADERNLIVTVHSYDPMYFTHQGADWAGADVHATGIVFPGPPATPLPIPTDVKPHIQDWLRSYNSEPTASNPCSPAVQQEAMNTAREWSDYFGRPVHLGEFGAYIKTDVNSRARYCGEFRRAAEGAGIAWALWDWKAGFRYWNPDSDRVIPEMRAALFGK